MSSQQSWAAWLLDSYASSVSPVTSDFPHRHHDSPSTSESSPCTASASTAQSPMSSISNSSAYGPYVRTGRGGAGNFTWQTELKPVKPSSQQRDLEAQQTPQNSLSERRKAAAKLEHIDTQEAVRMRSSSAQYLSVGRGGAGNYTTSEEIRQAKRSPSLPVRVNSTTVKASSPPIQHPFHPGRGGAGNYAAAAEVSGRTKSEKEEEERRAAEQRREQIIEEVDGLLQPPPGAWLGPERRRSDALFENV